MGLLSLIPVIGEIIDKIIPDKAAADAAKLELLKLQVSDSQFTAKLAADANNAQVELNKVEAASENMFIAGWRPFIGWVCASAFALYYVVMPLAVFIAPFFGVELPELPKFDMSELMPVLFGLLGLGGLRTLEKIKGVKGK